MWQRSNPNWFPGVTLLLRKCWQPLIHYDYRRVTTPKGSTNPGNNYACVSFQIILIHIKLLVSTFITSGFQGHLSQRILYKWINITILSKLIWKSDWSAFISLSVHQMSAIRFWRISTCLCRKNNYRITLFYCLHSDKRRL